MSDSDNMIHAVAASVAPGQDATCFAASVNGLKRSTNGGLTWHDAYELLEPKGPITTLAVALSPAFLADQAVFAGVIGGMLTSVDGGRTWSIFEPPAPAPAIVSFAVSPDFTQDCVVFAGALEDGVFRSDDGGRSWSAWNFGLLDLKVLDLAISPEFATDDTVFAGTESGIFRSSNGGRAWREVGFSSGSAPVIKLAISPTFGADRTLFAATESAGLYRSGDGGESWSSASRREEAVDTALVGTVNEILVSPGFASTPDMLVLVPDGVRLSRDGGQTWNPVVLSQEPKFDIASVTPLTPVGPEMGLLLGLMDGGIVTTKARVL